MNFSNTIMKKVIAGNDVEFQEALLLYKQPLEELCNAANKVRIHFCGNIFDLCTIISAKSGSCSEDCKYCAQSVHYETDCPVFPLISKEKIIDNAIYNSKKGINRYSIVTSGKCVSDEEIENICNAVKEIKKISNIKICASLGLLNKSQYEKIYNAGITRVHNNLETSRDTFKNMCTTHTFDDKVQAITNAKAAKMSICSGGILGIGESIEDRIKLAFSLKYLDIKSIPLNLLNPIAGTPFQDNPPLDEIDYLRSISIFRFINPDSFIRLAGGRGLLSDKGRKCFMSGANATISGDMLTTAGISIDSDIKMLTELGFIIL